MPGLARRALLLLLATRLAGAPSAAAQTTERTSLAWNGAQAALDCLYPALSGDGRFAGFFSRDPNLVPGDTNGASDAFLRDRLNATTEIVSLADSGAQANDDSFDLSISGDGRFAAFWSYATNLVAGDTGLHSDVFVRDRQLGRTERASVSAAGIAGNDDSFKGSLTPDGRFVCFLSYASNLVAGDTNHCLDVFVRDRQAGTIDRVDLSSSGAEGNDDTFQASISADGRFVAFSTWATNFARVEAQDVFVRDRVLGTTELVSRSSAGVHGNGASMVTALSADGRYVAFGSAASNLVVGDTNAAWDVFVRDRTLGTTERVSVATSGAEGNAASGPDLAISADGRFVAFASAASNLVDGVTLASPEVYVRDRLLGTTTCVSVATGGAPGCFRAGDGIGLSADGRFVAFASQARNLVAGDSNGQEDVFLHDGDTTVVALLCEPGAAGVAPCPCDNPASGPGLGCQNSSGSGGAAIAAAGSARLSADDLVFTTSGQTPGALGVLVQGDAFLLAGEAYGQGVRCVGGTLAWLFTKAAAGQGIVVPDAAAGEPSISARSSALGDAIGAGETRWYFVLYRDPIVHGSCAATSTFNATPTRQATWAP
jgi:hypothetical protein